MAQVWKRKLGNDWKKRIWLFDTLVWTVACYGVEIWGVERERERGWRGFMKDS